MAHVLFEVADLLLLGGHNREPITSLPGVGGVRGVDDGVSGEEAHFREFSGLGGCRLFEGLVEAADADEAVLGGLSVFKNRDRGEALWLGVYGADSLDAEQIQRGGLPLSPGCIGTGVLCKGASLWEG